MEVIQDAQGAQEAKNTKKTRQWIRYELYEAMERTSRLRPDLETSVKIIDRGAESEGKIVQVEITINNVGKTVFLSRYTHFLISSVESMLTYVQTLNF